MATSEVLMRTDTERLDWISRIGVRVNPFPGGHAIWEKGERWSAHTLREAIDKAMSADTKPGEESEG